jgi:hypothetical protein
MKADRVIELIELSERIYLGYPEATVPGQNWMRKHFKYPIKLVSKGTDFATKEILILGILYCLGFYGISELLKMVPLEINPIILDYILSIIFFGSLFLVLFFPPSIYCKSKISSEIINKLTDLLSKDDTVGYIDILDIYENQTKNRIACVPSEQRSCS